MEFEGTSYGVGQETLQKLPGLVGREPPKKNVALGLKISTSLILASYLSGGGDFSKKVCNLVPFY